MTDPLAPYRQAPPEIVRAMGGVPPTGQQWEAISAPLEPRAVIAGAGSGKTAVMAARVTYVVLEGLAAASQILCLTFTNKATEELARRVRDATKGLALGEGDEPTVLTYHSFGQRLLSDYGTRLGLEPGAMLLTEAHRWQIAASLLTDREFEHVEVRTLGTVLDYCMKLNDACADHCVTVDEVIAESRRQIASFTGVKGLGDIVEAAWKRCEVADLVREYNERKGRINAFDFGDLIALANRLAETSPEVVEEFRQRFSVVLLDEYQDTNIAQARLLRTLCGRGYPVLAVGDPDQNIYAWRGASLANLLHFSRDFGRGEEHLPLYVNFRSGSRILSVAQQIIDAVPPARRVADKVLEPHEGRGAGRVVAFVETDERAEARRMAGLIRAHAVGRGGDGEPRWSDVAILARKKRLFPALAEVLRDEGIPVEVVDLGGLLRLPEIIDVVSWLRILENPARNVQLARLLQGPAWRIGYRDLVALARWSARHNRALTEELEDVERPGDVAFALMEALDHLDDEDMTGLSGDARERLKEFRAMVAELQQQARRSLTNLAAAIIEQTGLLRELEASTAPAAAGARRNLANFLEFLTTFSPVEGEASLSTLIAWIDAAEHVEDEMEPAQPSDENTVKLMTVHKAKGLEWPVVFVPGLAEHERWGSDIFPDIDRQPNPLTRAETLPYELRGDREALPSFDADPKHFKAFKEELKGRALEDERRLCYVALTRARDVLVVSSAYWYGESQEPHEPGRFYREIAACADIVDVVHEVECPAESPLVRARAERAPSWPRPARGDDRDPLFPEGRQAAAERAAADRAYAGTLVAPPDREEFDRQLRLHVDRIELVSRRTAAPGSVALPVQIGATALIDYLRCPKMFYWSVVRPLPRRPSPAARIGTDVHRWIELQGRGQGTLLDLDELPDLVAEERTGSASPVARLRESFRASRFARTVPLYAERKFLLVLGGFVVGGRIDAIFGSHDGPWEIVDYKTGRAPDSSDELSGVQLDIYAVAANEVWGKRSEELTLTYFYLDAGHEVSRPAGDLEAARARIEVALGGIAARRFDPVPGSYCARCDFLSFCKPGSGFIASRSEFTPNQ